MDKEIARIFEAGRAVAQERSADVILANIPIWPSVLENVRRVVDESQRRSGHKKVLVLLVTDGGDPHTSYQIGRLLQRRYEEVQFCIAGDCYSAGTILVLSGSKLIMSDDGRLGPLDVQILRKDEVGERLSGLTLAISMEKLHEEVFDSFEYFLLRLKARFRTQIALKTALEIAAKMSTDLYSDVYRQIDPLKVGEDARAMQIAKHYGQLLNKRFGNVKDGAIERLLEEYPSHSC
ncbi:MAG: hypothetical protein H3C58_03025, partial [Fimbriimonadaceae bacterium]|nr:hypothetical protein [Fimbriimonadaceae bacterium]